MWKVNQRLAFLFLGVCPSAGTSTSPSVNSGNAQCFGKLSNRASISSTGSVLRQAQQPPFGRLRDRVGVGGGDIKCRGKEKKLNKYLVVCGFWCTFAAKLRIGCRKGFICAWLI